jgi:hypothetical protein
VTITSDQARWSSSAFDIGGRRALDVVFLGLGLLLLAAEATVTRATPSKQDTP